MLRILIPLDETGAACNVSTTITAFSPKVTTPLSPSGGNDASLASSQCPRRCAIPDTIESLLCPSDACVWCVRTALGLGSNMSSPTDACEVAQAWCCDPHQYSVPAPCLHGAGGGGRAGDGRWWGGGGAQRHLYRPRADLEVRAPRGATSQGREKAGAHRWFPSLIKRISRSPCPDHALHTSSRD